MPILKIYNDDPILQASEIMSVMAYPNHELTRDEFERKVAFNLYIDEKERWLFGDGDDEYGNYIIEECESLSIILAEMLLYSDSYDDSLKKAFPRNGLYVGLTVIAMHKLYKIDNAYAGKNRASQFVTDILNSGGLKLSKKSIDLAWSKYKGVAHFWAAYSCLSLKKGNGCGGDLFLLKNNELLGIARFFQGFLFNYNSSNNRKIEFEAKQTWIIPEGVGGEVKEFDFDFGRATRSSIINWNNNQYSKKYK